MRNAIFVPLLLVSLFATACLGDERGSAPLPTPSFDCSGALSVDEAWEAATKQPGGKYFVTGRVFAAEEPSGNIAFDLPPSLRLGGPPDSQHSLSVWVSRDVEAKKYLGRTICFRGTAGLLPEDPSDPGVRIVFLDVRSRDMGVLD